jgi:hypothetical protein
MGFIFSSFATNSQRLENAISTSKFYSAVAVKTMYQ